jgi:MFS family permease
MTSHKNSLSREDVEKTKKHSIADGSAYNVMYGFGEQYITPYALKLGATSSEVGILASVPSFIGAIFQIVGAKLTERYKTRKKVVLLFVLIQALLILPLFIIPLLTKSILLLTIIFSLYLMASNAAGPGWNSWIGAVIPNYERAEYFSKRNKITLMFLVLSVLFAGIILNYFTNTNIWIGFGILFTISFFGRLTSWYYLTKQVEPEYHVDNSAKFSFRDFLRKMPETNFGNFVMFRSLMALAVMIASPFFAVYMLKDLDFTYIQYTVIVLVPMLIKILTVTYWGKYSKTLGTRNIMIVSAILIGFIPLAWFIAGYFYFGHPIIFFLIMIAEAISGFAWAGFELTTFTYVLETVSPLKRARCVAYFNIVFGTAVLIGGLSGSYLVSHLPKEYHGISTLLLVFIMSAVARFMVPLIFISKLKEVKIKKNIDEKKLFLDLVISKPLHSAMHQTAQVMFLAEEGVTTIRKKANAGLNIAKKPLDPVIKGVIKGISTGLERAEPIRKAIEPKRIREGKKKAYEQLTNYNYRRYILTHPKIVKKIGRRGK